MDKAKLIQDLRLIRKSIICGAHGGVTDTAWMVDADDTIVERIDAMLVGLGVSYEELEAEAETFME